MRTIVTGIAVAAALALVAFLVAGAYRQPAPLTDAENGSAGQVCTMEAKMCPDGSYVGRTGPNCEFAECPATTTPASESGTVKARIGQKVMVGNISITPIAVVDDSRCPRDVQCIWAGTVHLRAALGSGLGSSEMTFELGTAITTEAESITLSEVAPAKSSGTDISPSEYVFTFSVEKR